jgi:hypothetical protein
MVTFSPMVRLVEETEHAITVGIFVTVKDVTELEPPSWIVSPIQMAATPQEPRTGGVYTSLYEPLASDITVLLTVDSSGLV